MSLFVDKLAMKDGLVKEATKVLRITTEVYDGTGRPILLPRQNFPSIPS